MGRLKGVISRRGNRGQSRPNLGAAPTASFCKEIAPTHPPTCGGFSLTAPTPGLALGPSHQCPRRKRQAAVAMGTVPGPWPLGSPLPPSAATGEGLRPRSVVHERPREHAQRWGTYHSPQGKGAHEVTRGRWPSPALPSAGPSRVLAVTAAPHRAQCGLSSRSVSCPHALLRVPRDRHPSGLPTPTSSPWGQTRHGPFPVLPGCSEAQTRGERSPSWWFCPPLPRVQGQRPRLLCSHHRWPVPVPYASWGPRANSSRGSRRWSPWRGLVAAATGGPRAREGGREAREAAVGGGTWRHQGQMRRDAPGCRWLPPTPPPGPGTGTHHVPEGGNRRLLGAWDGDSQTRRAQRTPSRSPTGCERC